MNRLFACALAASALLVAQAGCGEDERDYFVQRYDAGLDATADAAADASVDVDPTIGGPCVEDAQCDDGFSCTFDRCDQSLSRCRHVPDDSLCEDGLYCNGQERCFPRTGCVAGPVVTCQDDNPCTIDRCEEASKACLHDQRDVDGDLDPDDHCVVRRDCDDNDPTVSSLKTEICHNGKDDDCDGAVDEQSDCKDPENDVCGTATKISAPGTYLLSTVAARKDYASGCELESPLAASDIVSAVVAPSGGPWDIRVWARTSSSTNDVSVALQRQCGEVASEVQCSFIDGTGSARAIARGVLGGDTIYAVVTTQSEGSVDFEVDIDPAAPAPTNEDCSRAGKEPQPILLDEPVRVSLIDASKDLVTACDRAKTGELTYSFTLPKALGKRDVRIFASVVEGAGDPVITLRDKSCGELRCRVGGIPPLFVRGLDPGTYTIGVAATAQLEASVVVRAYDETLAPASQSCLTAPPLVPNTTFQVPLDSPEHEAAIPNACVSGQPAAAYELTLVEASDVLVIGRFAPGREGGVSLNGPNCTVAQRLGCATGLSPVRLSVRNVPPGKYFVGISDPLGQAAQLTALVRPYTAPTDVGASDGCVGTVMIPQTGGYFSGTTTAMAADFDAACDVFGAPVGGARDQLLRLDLAENRRVVFEMSGSTYRTLLDLRQGASCPGTEIPGACHYGPLGDPSFLDTTLGAGTHWVQVDGYGSASGAWKLDVRVLPLQ